MADATLAIHIIEPEPGRFRWVLQARGADGRARELALSEHSFDTAALAADAGTDALAAALARRRGEGDRLPDDG